MGLLYMYSLQSSCNYILVNLVAYTCKADCTTLQVNFYITFPLRRRSGTVYCRVPQQENICCCDIHIITSCYVSSLYVCSRPTNRSDWLRGVRRSSATARLLGLWVRIPPKACMSVLSVVCCQVEVSASG
jgi:hypothetical protein